MIDLLFSVVILGILYACITSNMSFLKLLLIYILCCEIRLAIVLGGFSFGMFFISLGIYLFSGFILLLFLRRIRDSWGLPGFFIFGTIIQEVISAILSAII